MSYLTAISTPAIFDSLDITESTKRDYMSRLPQFIGFMRREGISYDLLLHYKQYLRNRTDLGIASKNKYLAVARITLRELCRQGKLSVDLSQGVKAFQQSNKHRVQGINEEEVERLCAHLRSLDDSFRSTRLRTLIALLLFQGLRQIEICRLDVRDVQISSSTLLVLGKGRDDKEPIYLHPETVKALRAYLRSSHVKDGPLFTSLLGQAKGKRLSTRGLRMIIQQLLHELGIERTVHGFRHYFTTRVLKVFRGNILLAIGYTRHRSVDTLQVYYDDISVEPLQLKRAIPHSLG